MNKLLLHNFNRSFRIRSRGRLPHWELDDAIYSITYRLVDSLPRTIIEHLKNERETMIRRLARGKVLTASERCDLDLEFHRRLDVELDRGYGSCLLRDPRVARMVIDNWLHFDDQRYRLIAWCVMPNHVHLIAHVFRGAMLDRIFHSWKSYSSHEANKILDREGTVWQREYFDRIVRDRKDLASSVEYVLNNPKNAGLGSWEWVGIRRDRLAELL